MTDKGTHDSGRILGQVARLLALAKEGVNEHEAAAAAAKAQDLMFKYNISTEEAQNAHDAVRGGETIHTVIGYKVFSLKMAGGGNLNWRRLLYFGITRTNFCKAIILAGRGRSYTMGVVGEEHNIQMCEYLYAYLAQTIWHLADSTFIRMKYRQGLAMPNGNTWKDEFCMAAMAVVIQRLNEQFATSKLEYTGSSALIVVKDKLVTAEFARLFPKTTSGWAGNTDRNGHATALGQEAGRNIDLNRRGVGAGERKEAVLQLNG